MREVKGVTEVMEVPESTSAKSGLKSDLLTSVFDSKSESCMNFAGAVD